MWKKIKALCKMGLVYFVLITASCGYFLGLEVEQSFSFTHYFTFLFSLALFTMGSFALNEYQEADLDKKMPRTSKRPIPAGEITKKQAFWFAWGLMLVATVGFATVSIPLIYLAWFTVFCYNFLYTKLWKTKWVFAAVPGAIPGAMPVVLGYSASKPDFLTQEIIYLFLIMFLWQMPHFWSLAIRYKEDYAKGGVPVLPSVLGNYTTIYHMGLYLFVYVALALAAPFFVQVHKLYYILILPFSIVVLWQFYHYQKHKGEKNWLRFFMWVNFSMLAFLLAPVLDKWLLIWFQ